MLTTSHIQLDIWRFWGDPKGSQKPPFPIWVQGWSSWKLWLFYTIFMLKIQCWVFKVIWNFASAYFWGQTSSILSITTIEPISDIWSNRSRNIGAMLLISKIYWNTTCSQYCFELTPSDTTYWFPSQTFYLYSKFKNQNLTMQCYLIWKFRESVTITDFNIWFCTVKENIHYDLLMRTLLLGLATTSNVKM